MSLKEISIDREKTKLGDLYYVWSFFGGECEEEERVINGKVLKVKRKLCPWCNLLMFDEISYGEHILNKRGESGDTNICLRCWETDYIISINHVDRDLWKYFRFAELKPDYDKILKNLDNYRMMDNAKNMVFEETS